jgi:hypothetical protein
MDDGNHVRPPSGNTPASDRRAAVVSAVDVLAMLRRHYLPEGRPAGGLFAPEIGSPNGTRRADLIWLPTTVTGGASRWGPALVGHEVKVSRADVLTELSDPTKADPWMRYCTAWWLVVADPALVAGLDVPPTWGVMAPPSGRRTRSMTVLRPAPELHPAEQTPAVARLLAWEMGRAERAASSLENDLRWKTRRVAELEDEVRLLRLSGAGKPGRDFEEVAAIVAAVRNRMPDAGYLYVDADRASIVEGICDLEAVRGAAKDAQQQLEAVLRQARQIVDPFRNTWGPLADLVKRTGRLAAEREAS